MNPRQLEQRRVYITIALGLPCSAFNYKEAMYSNCGEVDAQKVRNVDAESLYGIFPPDISQHSLERRLAACVSRCLVNR
jgi:hypothetical protein